MMKKRTTNLFKMSLAVLTLGMYSCDLQSPDELNPENQFQSAQDVLFQAHSISDLGSENLRATGNLRNYITFHEGKPFSGITTQFPASHTFRVINNPTNSKDKAGSFELRSNDRIRTKTTTSARAEILFPRQNNKERWYSYSIFFPTSGYAKDRDRELISQWHQSVPGSPPNGLSVMNDKITLQSINGRGVYTEYPIANVERGKWNEFIFHFIHSPNSDGLIEVWYNGKKVQHIRGGNIRRGELPRFKLGVYKWRWDKGNKTDTNVRKLFFNNIKIGSERSSFNEMRSNSGSSNRMENDEIDTGVYEEGIEYPEGTDFAEGEDLSEEFDEEDLELEEEVEEGSTPEILDFKLISANNQEAVVIEEGETITATTNKLSIQANMPDDFKGEVKFELTGENIHDYSSVEPPFTLFGDDGKGNFNFGAGLKPGDYTLEAYPVQGKFVGKSKTIEFSIK